MANFAMDRAVNLGDPSWHIALAAALAEVGRFEDAVAALDAALERTNADGQRQALTRRRALYAGGQPFRRNR